ncbi:type II toxin-antitoxin system VapC family toxin [Saccharolobus caldissimus]|uniref:DNA-binding protein n=1 Tax=Saccharolobus caldissimus TaxID=1702097 RepID=A0AAQ4CW76_9CREN|nr:type II toxin-antitoxin system VapC family toxin [Saccharolobus caldissimus]BDC00058.1 DNA-binding protein [Saccharolobus caldissimus]
MVVLDTNVIIKIMRGNKELLNFIEQNYDDHISTTVINVYEIMRGRNKKLKELFEEFIIYPLTIEAVEIASEIYRRLKSNGKIKSDADILIAAIVKANNELLITLDNDFQEIKDLGGVNINIIK